MDTVWITLLDSCDLCDAPFSEHEPMYDCNVGGAMRANATGEAGDAQTPPPHPRETGEEPVPAAAILDLSEDEIGDPMKRSKAA